MIYGETREAVEKARASFVKKWRLRCPPVIASFEEAGGELFTFLHFPPMQWKALRTTNALERINEEFRRRTKTQAMPVGREGVRRVLHDIHHTLPDHRWDILDMVAEGDDVVVRCKVSGIHLGTGRLAVNGGLLVGVPPTGRRFEVQHIHWYKVRDGKIVDHRANRDDIGLMQQLGLLPSPDRLDSMTPLAR
jgi:predicted ester cyclase